MKFKIAFLSVPLLGAVAGLFALSGCQQQQASNRVVVYCSVDDVYARPILASLAKQTGLDIEPLFDVESAKAAGLANKIRAEHNRPRADVFWASTVLQSELLTKEGQLAPYVSPSASDIPAEFKDPQGYWTGMGLRARVLIAPKPSQQKSLAFVPDKLVGQFAISNPQFGTASDWVAAYGSRWGIGRTSDYFKRLKNADVRILPGNADVALGVANGELAYGITDSDDFLSQKRQKRSVYLVKTTEDNVLIPGCVSMVAGSPHPENAHKLLDALLTAESEQQLIKDMPGVFSVRHVNDASNWQSGGEDFSYLKDKPTEDYTKWRASWEALRKPLADILLP